jgi:hypothetical protein
MRQAEEEAHQRKDRLEEEVLAVEPRTADEALSVLLVAADELRHVPQAGALQGVVRWLVGTGATSPLLRTYRPLPAETFPEESGPDNVEA